MPLEINCNGKRRTYMLQCTATFVLTTSGTTNKKQKKKTKTLMRSQLNVHERRMERS